MAAAGGVDLEPETWLVGDIGATNARFGLVSPDRQDTALAQPCLRALPDDR